MPAASLPNWLQAKMRWRARSSEHQSFIDYVSHLATRRARLDRESGARHAECLADLVTKHYLAPPAREILFLYWSLADSAFIDYMVIGPAGKAVALAERWVAYTRRFVLWDASRSNLLETPLRHLVSAAMRSEQYAKAEAAGVELTSLPLWRTWIGKSTQPNLPSAAWGDDLRFGVSWRPHWSEEENDVHFASMRGGYLQTLGRDLSLLMRALSNQNKLQDAELICERAQTILRAELSQTSNRALALECELDRSEWIVAMESASTTLVRFEAAAIEAEALAHRHVEYRNLLERVTQRLREFELRVHQADTAASSTHADNSPNPGA